MAAVAEAAAEAAGLLAECVAVRSRSLAWPSASGQVNCSSLCWYWTHCFNLSYIIRHQCCSCGCHCVCHDGDWWQHVHSSRRSSCTPPAASMHPSQTPMSSAGVIQQATAHQLKALDPQQTAASRQWWQPFLAGQGQAERPCGS